MSGPTADGELLELLSRHLGAGRLDAKHVEALARLDSLCPPEARHPAPARLYRAVTIGQAQHEKLSRGEDIILDPRGHDCWSRSDLAIRMLMRTRVDQEQSLGACLLLRRDFAADEIAIDIELLARHLGMNKGGSTQWFNYVLPEQEIIVRNPEGPVIIRPRDVAQSWCGDDLAKLWEPAIGEVFLDEDDVERTVEEFLGPDDCGNALVRSGEHRYRMDCYSGFWHVTETTEFLSQMNPQPFANFRFV